MLFLLRKLRNKMLQKNKIATYMLYAIGEIVLVVAGILIAVQIDAWNKTNQNKEYVKHQIDQLIVELRKDSTSIDEDLAFLKPQIDDINTWYDRITQNSSNIDTVIQVMKNDFHPPWVRHFKYNNSTYTSMINSGGFELLPDTIKTSISEVYKLLESREENVLLLGSQYRQKLDEYINYYVSNKHNTNDFIDNTIWHNVDPKHLVPRSISIIYFKKILFENYLNSLNSEKKVINNLIHNLNDYLTLNR